MFQQWKWAAACLCAAAVIMMSAPVEAQRGQRGNQGNRGNSGRSAQRDRGANQPPQRGSRSDRGNSNRGNQGDRGSQSQRDRRDRDSDNRGSRDSGGDRERGPRPSGDRDQSRQGRDFRDLGRDDLSREMQQRLEQFRNRGNDRGDGRERQMDRDGRENPGNRDFDFRRNISNPERFLNDEGNLIRNPRGADYLRNALTRDRDGDTRRNDPREDIRDRNRDADAVPAERFRDALDNARDRLDRDRDLDRGNNVAENRLRSRIDPDFNRNRALNQQLRNWNNVDQIANQIRRNFRQDRDVRVRFDDDFYRALVRNNNRPRGYFHAYAGLNNRRNYGRNYWWRPVTANVLSSWLRGGYGQPRYYSYGRGRDIYCRNGYVYVRGDRYSTIPEYYNQAVTVIRSVPDISPEEAAEMEWKPLGVFALTSDENQEASFIIQLAINRDGILSGTFYDEQTRETRPLLGRVDEESQRAIWHFADDPENGVVMETMLYNLSQDQTSVMVHFGEETVESWLMVRLPEPEEF